MSGEPMKQPAVGGRRIERTIADLERAALVCLAEEQEKPNPDNALIAVLCDTVRLGREYADSMRFGWGGCAESRKPSSAEGARSTPAPGWAALRWSEEQPRAGWWWWRWDLKSCVFMAHVEEWANAPADVTMHMSGVTTRTQRLSEAGGWWAGPLESPDASLVAPPPNAKLIERPDGAPELEPACEAASMQRLARRSADKSGAPDSERSGRSGVGGDSNNKPN
jgi:hypothetical protein